MIERGRAPRLLRVWPVIELVGSSPAYRALTSGERLNATTLVMSLSHNAPTDSAEGANSCVPARIRLTSVGHRLIVRPYTSLRTRVVDRTGASYWIT
jgi:hypothetical protein